MDVLLDPKIIGPVLFGAVLAFIGGAITQILLWRMSVKYNRDVLLIGLTAELKMVRDSLRSSLATYRSALKCNHLPEPIDFVFSTPTFNANAGNLGNIRNLGLVSYIVTTFDSIHMLSEKARLFYSIDTAALPNFAFNNIHIYATATHIQVIKLHNSLLKAQNFATPPPNDCEVESLDIFNRDATLIDSGQLQVVMQRKWGDA